MQSVSMEKTRLRERVQENRDKHRQVYEKAMKGYTRAAIGFFEEQLARAVEGKQFQSAFLEPMPTDHTDDYDAALDMLDMSVDDVITLGEREFKQYVRDEWGWKREFVATSMGYIGEHGEYPQ